MKKTTLLSVLLLVMALFVATSCGSDETAKKLNGKWEMTEGMAGMGVDGMKMTIDFNSSNMTGEMSVDVKAQGMDLMEMTIPFTWECSSSDISFKMKGDESKIKFSDTLKQMAQASGESLDEIEKQTKAELEKSMPALGTNTITELTDNRLVLSEDATKLTFKRVK